MKQERESDTSYFHNPIVQGVNYSLFIMLLKEMVLMELKGQPRVDPAAACYSCNGARKDCGV
jgi:hypothetical protein